MLLWKTDYETGSPLVDGQHKMLFEKINKLEQLLAAPQMPTVEIDALLSFLENYVANHFKFEESCMASVHCPAHAENKIAHAQFNAVLAQFKRDYAVRHADKNLLRGLHTSASAWIQGHILKVDIKLKPCLKH